MRNTKIRINTRFFCYKIRQLSLTDIFQYCQNKFDNDKYEFLELLEQTIDLDEIVPMSLISHFHAATVSPRKHQLYPILRVLFLQLILSIPTVSLLIIFLKYAQELQDFCGFDVVPDISLLMKRKGSKSHLRCSLPTIKFVCKKMKWKYDKTTKKSKRVCHYDNPCTASSYGRMIYIYPE